MTDAPNIKTRGERGFSLAEVLVAVALLAVILLALFGLVTAGVQRAYGGKKMTQATNIAQAVMESANVYGPQDLLGAVDTETVKTKNWVRVGTTVTPAAEADDGTTPVRERNRWRDLLATADLPVSPGKPATLTITTTPVGHAGATFGDAELVRVIVDLEWYEFGTRRRKVRLQALNLPEKP